MKNLIKKILNEQLTDNFRDERYYNHFVSYIGKEFPSLLGKLKKSKGGFSHFVRRGITDEPVFKNTEYVDQDGLMWVNVNMSNDRESSMSSGFECMYELNSDYLEKIYNIFNDDWLWEKFFNEYHNIPIKGNNWCFVL